MHLHFGMEPNNTSSHPSRSLLSIWFVDEAFWSEEVCQRMPTPMPLRFAHPVSTYPPVGVSGQKATTLVRN